MHIRKLNSVIMKANITGKGPNSEWQWIVHGDDERHESWKRWHFTDYHMWKP
jgi:hypothetical protein